MRYLIAISLVVSVCLCSQARSQQLFKRGDANLDDNVDISDPVFVLDFLFLGTPRPSCGDAADADDNSTIELTDAVATFGFLFLGQGPPPAPGPNKCGIDPTADELGCESYPCKASPVDVDGFTFRGENAQGYPEYRHSQTGILFVLLPGGEFQMGSPDIETRRFNDEGPVHTVTLSPFLIAKYEVTQAQYEAVMGSNPSEFTGNVQRPVEGVSWNELKELAGFLARTGLQLPSEARWEYACRAGQAGPFSGTGNLDDMGWWGGNSGDTTHPVGAKAANQFGLHDMHGNVYEWCEDVYHETFYSTPEAAGPDPVSTSGSESRVIRGGRFESPTWICRAAFRTVCLPSNRRRDLGFRPVMPLP